MEIRELMNEQYGLTPFPEKTVEAMAYVKFQPDNAQTYSPSQGFVAGTMFADLNKPFYGRKCGAHCD